MTGPRDNKTRKGRVSRSTRAIFWENLERALHTKVSRDARDAEKIRWLVKYTLVSRTQAQRLLKFGTDPKDEQTPNVDTLACIAEAFGVTAAQFLTQGCKFSEIKNPPPPDHPVSYPELEREALQRRSGGTASKRRSE